MEELGQVAPLPSAGPHAPRSQSPSTGDQAFDKTAASAGKSDDHSVEARLQGLVTGTPTKVVAGRMHLLGLEEIKASLGDRWIRHGEMLFDLIDRKSTRLNSSH